MAAEGVPISSTVPRVVDYTPHRNVVARLALSSVSEPIPKLTVPGQGCIVFIREPAESKKAAESHEIHLKIQPENSPCILEFILSAKNAQLTWTGEDGERRVIENFKGKNEPVIPDDQHIGWEGDDPHSTRYWLSLDRWNKTIRYGKGEMRLGCVLLERVYGETVTLFNKRPCNDIYKQMGSLKKIKFDGPIGISQVWTFPVVVEPPVAVVDRDNYSMDDAASTGYQAHCVGKDEEARKFFVSKVTAASLSTECQRLYSNTTGSMFVLDDSFLQALEYSLRDENGLGYKILKQKFEENEFGGDSQEKKAIASSSKREEEDAYEYRENYLRITLGYSQGDSPGNPYVMEIWPGGCGSPVHDHGGTYAIIKVLSGQINVEMFRQLHSTKPFREVSFQKGDVTYITPLTNQVHRLRNLKTNSSTCVTIQCYQYPDSATVHDPFFHYIEKGKPGDFDPLSDYDYTSFKRDVMDKWLKDGAPRLSESEMQNMWWQSYKPTGSVKPCQ